MLMKKIEKSQKSKDEIQRSFSVRFTLRLWALLHLAVWTIVPMMSNTCLPLDSVEAVSWGSQWQWGYDKHPPLSGWAAEIFHSAMGDAGIYFLAQLCVVLAGFGIYRIARLLELSKRQALFTVLVLDAVYFFQFAAVEFNVNIIQMPFWAWGWYFGIDALKNRKIASWVGLGLCVGLAALGKYLGVFLLAPLFGFWWSRGELKSVLKSPGLYLAGFVAFLLFLPHLIWMAQHDWCTLTYAMHRGGSEAAPWWGRIYYPLEFLLIQLAVLAPLVLLSLWSRFKYKGAQSVPGTIALALGGFVAMALIAVVGNIKPVDMWAAPMPLAIGLWLVPRFQLDQHPRAVFITTITMTLVFVLGYSIAYGLGPRFRKKPHRTNYPAHVLATATEQAWHQNYPFALDYIVADEFLGGIVNAYTKSRPAVMIRANLARSAYLTEAQVQKHGAIVLWLKSRNFLDKNQRSLKEIYPDLQTRFPTMRMLPDLIIPWPRRTDHRAGRYGLAIIPPKS